MLVWNYRERMLDAYFFYVILIDVCALWGAREKRIYINGALERDKFLPTGRKRQSAPQTQNELVNLGQGCSWCHIYILLFSFLLFSFSLLRFAISSRLLGSIRRILVGGTMREGRKKRREREREGNSSLFDT